MPLKKDDNGEPIGKPFLYGDLAKNSGISFEIFFETARRRFVRDLLINFWYFLAQDLRMN